MSEAPASPARKLPLVALVSLALLLCYAALAHHGVGPPPNTSEPSWWQPRGFLLTTAPFAFSEDRPLAATLVFTAPAALLAAVVFAATLSAILRTFAVAAALATMLFLFYGLRPPGPGIWDFFGWRGSAVMAGLAVTIASACTAPLLAASWLRLGWGWRVGLFAPVWLAVVALVTSSTGTNEALRFAISPWPVIPYFGIQVGVVFLTGLLAALAVAAAAMAGRARHPAVLPVGIVAALAIPVLWFRLWHGEVPGPIRVASIGLVALLLVPVLVWRVRGDGEAARARARHLAVGAVLVALPTLSAIAFARFEYTHTREVLAQRLIDALDAYYQREYVYPDSLAELTEAGDLESIPAPTIGLALFADQRFQYQAFGTSYVLEFASPGWVQCAYNPPWIEDEEDLEADDDGEDLEMLEEAWSCPSKPPELW